MKTWVEYAEAPLVVGTRTPRFSWEVPFAGRNRTQSAYQVLVATAEALLEPGKADLWDSGKVECSQSVNIEYAGSELSSNMDCYWVVRVWDETGTPSEFSPPGHFGTALLDESDWQAEWIGMGDPDEPFSDPTTFARGNMTEEVKAVEPDNRAPMLRKSFTLGKPVKRARAYVCGLGLHEFTVNGRKAGDDVLATPRTDFRKRALYASYDVTSQLGEGENVLGLMLGNGWFNGQKKFWGWQYQWYGSPRGIVQVEIEFEDGTKERVVSDGSWRGAWSPIVFNCVHDGEDYDARLEQDGWDAQGFDASEWEPVNLVPSPGGALEPMTHEQEQAVACIRPVSMSEPEPGVYIYDLGKNMTGWVRLNIRNGRAGETVKLRFAEAVYEDGRLNPSSNNAARQADHYTMKGAEEESFEPRFTYHGFQYVELTGYPGTPDLDTLEGRFVRVAVEQTGSFECANALINNIHGCTLQSQLCNVQMGVPTDDTQRPERLGWGADAWGTAVEALYNLWMPRVYSKWIGDFRDGQHEFGVVGMIAPQAGSEEDLVWSSAFLLIPWWQYLHHGDTRILEDNYESWKRYLDYLARVGIKEIDTISSDDLINKHLLWRCGPENRFPADDERGHLQLSQWGDHLATAEGSMTRANMPLSIATAFYYLDVDTMARIAGALERTEDAERYRALADEIKDAFNERFFDANTGYYDRGVQSTQAWPLAFGLTPEEETRRVADYLVRSVSALQRRLTTGYAGTKFAVQALSMIGRDDLVWELATATTYPSWGYMLRNNRTTSCEQWNGDRGSLNHAPLGASIDEWFYWGLAGIRWDESGPGFEKIVFKAHMPTDLPWAKASIETVRGRIASEWKRNGDQITWAVTVPANSTATVVISLEKADDIREGALPATEAEGVALLSSGEGCIRLGVGSGEYIFAFPVPE